MVTTNGLWQTAEAGKSWGKLPKLPAEARSSASTSPDEKHGWAVGAKKKFSRPTTAASTGRPWLPPPKPPADPQYSAYNWIAFATPQVGIITGWNMPPRRVEPASRLAGSGSRPRQPRHAAPLVFA